MEEAWEGRNKRVFEKSWERERRNGIYQSETKWKKAQCENSRVGVESEKLKDNKKGKGTSRGSQILLELLSGISGKNIRLRRRNGEMRKADSKIF